MAEQELLKSCMLGKMRDEKVCKQSDCSTCGWNPKVAAKREATKKFHVHKSGLKGF